MGIPKIFIKIVAIVVGIGIVFGVAVATDFSAYMATDSETLSPMGASVGSALVVYDPGVTGAAKGVAQAVAYDLQNQSYTVTLAGVRSEAAANISGYKIIVAGSPIYAGVPTASVKDFLGNITSTQGIVLGVFGSGSGPEEPSDIEMITNALAELPNADVLADAVVVKIGTGEDLSVRSADFVARLTS
ncbi:MAG: hypothetical protein NWF04_00125 [Candidatus Bathyarchaeota archaeon]|nr:hypothetical protein [Candidatus Bathyarchaeota archaeon]